MCARDASEKCVQNGIRIGLPVTPPHNTRPAHSRKDSTKLPRTARSSHNFGANHKSFTALTALVSRRTLVENQPTMSKLPSLMCLACKSMQQFSKTMVLIHYPDVLNVVPLGNYNTLFISKKFINDHI